MLELPKVIHVLLMETTSKKTPNLYASISRDDDFLEPILTCIFGGILHMDGGENMTRQCGYQPPRLGTTST
jgi:hypothetical protein